MKKAWVFLFLQLAFFCTRGQQCEWLNQGKGRNYNQSEAIAVNDSDDVVVVGNFDSTLTLGDSTFYLPTAQLQRAAGFIVQYTNDGRFLWANYLKFSSSKLKGSIVTDVACDKNNNVYITGAYYGSIDFRNGDTLLNTIPSEIGIFLAKYDSKGNFKWAKKIIDGSNSRTRTINITVDRLNNPVIVFEHHTKIYPEGGPAIVPTPTFFSNLCVLKYNDNGVYQWAKSYFDLSNHTRRTDISTDANSNIYFITTNIDSITGRKNIRFGLGTTLVKLDKNGKELNALKIYNNNITYHVNLAVLDDGRFVISGEFRDSVDILGTKLYRGSLTSSSNQYLALFTADFNLTWAIKNTGPGVAYPLGVAVKNHNIYVGGFSQGQEKFGNFSIGLSNPNYMGFYLVKVDTLSNVLWAFGGPFSNGSSVVKAVAADSYGNGFLTGEFYNNLTIFGKTVDTYPDNSGADHYTAKIVDYTITRGYVSAGPYCAGDSIFIPYTKTGKYDWGNEFIAEISDSSGSFDQPIVLGRLKDTVGGVIGGVLPFLNVPTNNKYRIRVLSTMPGVTSFYKRDTLRLLIYSRDSANAGRDTQVCGGQKVQLSTTGGSRWQWSPAASLDNPALNKPTASPVKDTEYRIIISDSSGCGDTDTDYVWVRVRLPLDISAPFTDTTICRGQAVTLYANTNGGDSLNHIVSWYERRGGNDVLLGTGNKFITTTCSDSCAFQPKTIFAVLEDNCTVKPDTQLYKIDVMDALEVDIVTPDTLLCQKQNITITINSKGGNGKYTIDWYGSNGLIATADSLKLAPAQADTYYAVLTDNCTIKTDTAKIAITVRLPLSLVLDAIDSICQKQPLVLRAKPSGGDTTKYSIQWTVDSGPWTAFQNPAIDTPKTTAYYTATLTDNCSPPVKDSIKVTVLPTPKADFILNPKGGCPPLRVTFTDNSTQNDSIYNQWKILLDEAKGVSTYSRYFVAGGTYTIGLQVSNQFGCTDITTRNETITVWSKPKALFAIKPDIKETEKELQLYNYSSGASKFIWDMGDGNFFGATRNDTTYSYKEAGNYPVRLIAESDRGCKDTTEQNFKVFDRLQCIVPNAFTPNGDGINNTFSPVCSGVAKYTLTIYNRWGEVLQECENCSWDGSHYGIPVTDGAYMYMLRVEAESKKWETIFGVVTLLR